MSPKPKTRNFPPITIEEIERANYDSHHITRCKFARDEITGAVYAFDGAGPFEVDEDGVSHYISPRPHCGARKRLPDVRRQRPRGQARPQEVWHEIGRRACPTNRPGPPPKTQKPETGNSPQLTPAERRIREKLKEHWYGPDPWASTPGLHAPRPLTPLVRSRTLQLNVSPLSPGGRRQGWGTGAYRRRRPSSHERSATAGLPADDTDGMRSYFSSNSDSEIFRGQSRSAAMRLPLSVMADRREAGHIGPARMRVQDT